MAKTSGDYGGASPDPRVRTHAGPQTALTDYRGKMNVSIGGSTTQARFRQLESRPRANSRAGPIPSAFSIPSLREAKAKRAKEYEARARSQKQRGEEGDPT
jgi:hypothetical protein